MRATGTPHGKQERSARALMLVTFAACAIAPALARADGAPVAAPRPLRHADFRQCGPAQRLEIDAQALACPDTPALEKDGPFFGGLAGWIVSRAPLSPEEEFRRAEAAAVELEERFVITDPPAAASDVLQALVAELPERQAVPPVKFSLRVIDIPQWMAFTPGGGRLFVSKPYLEALLADAEHGRGRLAFVLAHELGHIALEHTRRGYQLAALEDAARGEALDEVERARLRRLVAASLRRAGDWVAFLYGAEQDYEADLFAIHVCRNADFDLEAALDVPRLWTRRNEPASGNPVLNAILEHNRNTPPLERLKRLRHEVDGVLIGDAHGLREFDPERSEFVPAGECALPAGRRGVVFIHGMGSRLETFIPLAELLEERDVDDRLVLFGFQYPGDASLARVGQALTRELAAFGNDAERLDFICHSAGGLAFRWYAEIESGRFRQAVFLGTPHGGSNLAALRDFLEVQQFVADLRLGVREAVENVAADGDGQIGHDLQPGSLFLRYLNRGRPYVDRYMIFRGRRHEGRRVILLRVSTATLRSALRRAAPETVRLGPVEDVTERWIERLQIPDEILRGDLAVSMDSAALEGVERIETVRASHHKLQRDPDVMHAVADLVLAGP